MLPEQIIELIQHDTHFVYGIRADNEGLPVGYHFPNSHQWWQDDPEGWDIFHRDFPYVDELDLWDGGELDGVCACALCSRDHLSELRLENVSWAIQNASHYLNRCTSHEPQSLYLVGGDLCYFGNDYDEIIIPNGICIACLDE